MKNGRIPDFFIVGAPKSGTTALYEYLRNNPDIFMPRLKEPHFYASDLELHQQCPTIERYERLFQAAGQNQVVGEASVFYLFSRVALDRILQDNPEAKTITLIRNPIDMAYSLHNQFVWSQREPITNFEQAWRCQHDRKRRHQDPLLQYRDVCSIGTQLQRYFDTIPDRQRLIILFDSLKANPSYVYQRVLRYLQVRHDGRTEFSVINSAKTNRSQLLRKVAAWAYKSSPRTIRNLGDIVGVHPIRWINALNAKHQGRAPLRSEFRVELETEFRDEFEKIESLLGVRWTGNSVMGAPGSGSSLTEQFGVV